MIHQGAYRKPELKFKDLTNFPAPIVFPGPSKAIKQKCRTLQMITTINSFCAFHVLHFHKLMYNSKKSVQCQPLQFLLSIHF